MDHRQQLQIQRQSSSSGHQQQYQYNQLQSSSNNNQQFSQKHQGAPIHQINNQMSNQQYNMQQHAQNQHQQHTYYTQQQMQHANQAAQFQSQHSQSYPSSQSQQQHHMQQSHSSSTYQPPVINGPRAKCNQVIYEAITKSCEIAVRGRCTNLLDDNMFNMMNSNNINVEAGSNRGYSDGMINTHNSIGRDIQTAGSFGRRNTITTPHHTDKRRSWNYGGNKQQQSSSTSTSSRFNIEVNEVPTIRSTVSSTWKKSIHLPLRLDIYYEYDSCYDQQQQEILGQQEGAPPPPPQRELLERWCIDYIPSTSSSTQSQSLYNSLSSSPSTSPYSSPYSSRILTGAITNSPRTDNNKSSSSSSMSQLRQVCKRIVILLRSLHCMTRMLPAYQLKCALISNMLGAVDGVLTQQQQQGHPQQSNQQQSVGWGHIGYSIHVGDEQTQYDPPLPSPSFQRQTLPSASTPYGNMVLSVMYDATLQPNHMLYDIVERRNGWLHSLHQQQHGGQYNQQQHIPPVVPTNTQPIPINTHVVGQHVSNSPGPLTINSLPQNVSRRREYGSCPPAALMMGGHPSSFGTGVPASSGSNAQQQQRSRAASINIISDYHYSPRLKPISSPGQKNHLTPSSANTSSPATGQNKRVMSGLSLAMMNEDDNTSPVEDQVPPPSSSPHDNDHQLHPQAQREVDALILPFGSPMTRAAFHNPPPILSNDESEAQPQQQAYSSGVEDRGTHFFKQHGGYGYGYNGSNLQFTDERQQQTKEDKVPPPPFTPSLGLSISPNPRVLSNNTPPPSSPGTTSLRQSRSGTPPTSVLSSRPLISSPRQYHQQGLISDSRSGSDIQRSSRHRTASSSAVDLLPPVSTLDMLGKSPFAKSRKRGDTTPSSSDSGGEKLLSSIPRVVNDKSDSTGVSTLGGGEGTGSSTNPSSSATGQQTNSSGNRDRNNTDSGEQLPFAVDDDDDNPSSKGKSSDSPLKASGIKANRELWGSTKADMLGDDGPGGITLGVAETMAVSSLAHRCATDSKVRLRMFESSPAVGRNELSNTATSVSRPSIKDQLSDFRSFGASLMMDSTNESDKNE